MNEYQEKLRSLGFTPKPTTSKRVVKRYEDTNRVVGYETETGTPGTGVSDKVDANITGGQAYLTPQAVRAMANE